MLSKLLLVASACLAVEVSCISQASAVALDESGEEGCPSHVVFLQTRLHGGRNHNASKTAEQTNSTALGNLSLTPIELLHAGGSSLLAESIHQNSTENVSNAANRSSLSDAEAGGDSRSNATDASRLATSGSPSAEYAAATAGAPAHVPTFGDYIKAVAALAAETTASVGDQLGGTSSADAADAGEEDQDEAIGTSAAVGATLGVVVGATIGVN
eukprot:gb/GFBE01029892.1/.p1 GENE.gb/GFBE01029892.1/~~gb/GFBE01029892.1/.p1  ORF type:complete len:214 (+),score=36.61 gb/GFBE01029892.1/:1-642(+)